MDLESKTGPYSTADFSLSAASVKASWALMPEPTNVGVFGSMEGICGIFHEFFRKESYTFGGWTL
jgi:hypothetical protein